MPEQKKANMNEAFDGTPTFLSAAENKVRPLVDANIRMTIFCVDELRKLEFTANYPVLKVEYFLNTREGEEVLHGEKDYSEQPVMNYTAEEILPLDEMVQYERTEPPFYFLDVHTTISTGKVLKGAYSLAGSLVKSYESTECPYTNLSERMAAIPLATPDMTEDELRKICVDFIDLQSEFPYKLPYDVDVYVESQKKKRILRPGIVHAGTPYITVGSGSLYRIVEFYDEETGMISPEADYLHVARLFGNACSGSAAISWSRVVNSAKRGYTMACCAANGSIPIGDYQYDFSISQFQRGDNPWTCKKICANNGEQVMYESYACVKPADGGVNDGHVRMFVEYPVVVRNEDGSIDGEKSYVAMSEQVCYTTNPNHVRIHPDGSHYIAQGGVHIKYTFENLFSTGYLPFTFAEFLGTKKVDYAKVWVSEEKDEYTAEDIGKLVVNANYNISDVFFTVTDEKGEVLFKHVFRAIEFCHRSYDMAKVLPGEVIEKLDALKGNTLSIDVQLYNGTKPNLLTTVIK